jgi:hypothetical protein
MLLHWILHWSLWMQVLNYRHLHYLICDWSCYSRVHCYLLIQLACFLHVLFLGIPRLISKCAYLRITWVWVWWDWTGVFSAELNDGLHCDNILDNWAIHNKIDRVLDIFNNCHSHRNTFEWSYIFLWL